MSSKIISDLSGFDLDLPDPGQENLNIIEFLARLEKAWEACDRFDLQTEIWRGRILSAVRDREKIGGEGRGAAHVGEEKAGTGESRGAGH